VQAFKHNGGVGAFLRATLTPTSAQWGMRLVYDNLFNIILMTIMLNSEAPRRRG
jgi:hypothetical protein